MKKIKPFLRFSFLIVLLELLAVVVLATQETWVSSVYPLVKVSFVLVALWFCGCIGLLLKKGKLCKLLSGLLTVCTGIVAAVLLVFASLCLLAETHGYRGSFSASTSLFENKNVMIVVPHQDDDMNLMGGLIEQYTENGSNVSVVFATNGDRYGAQEIRAAEAVTVLTSLGVEKDNIYYLGFGNAWVPQTIGGEEIQHIYNSPDPELVWTSMYGATQTYGTQAIDRYLDLPYTRDGFVHSLQSVMTDVMPDTIFALDFDSHIDHRATDLFFEEALCGVLRQNPQYRPTVYKGFGYATAWLAADDYFISDNLLSTKKPDSEIWTASVFGYAWGDRVRFPMGSTNLNWIFSNNSVYNSMHQYASQDAWRQADQVLNGDKVFWERRTDRLLYNAEIYIGSEKTPLLNNFKLKDFQSLVGTPGKNSDVAVLAGERVSVQLNDAVTMNSIYLYDSTDPEANILEGHITFSDGSGIDFGPLNADGSATKLSFPKKKVEWMELTVTESSGEGAGLTEMEAFYDSISSAETDDTILMAVDSDDNFVYDYLLHGTDTVTLKIGRFPLGTFLSESDVTLDFSATDKGASYAWENDTLTVTCASGSKCTVTVSDGAASTTFSVSHPAGLSYGYLQALRTCEQIVLNIDLLYETVVDFLIYFIDAHF